MKFRYELDAKEIKKAVLEWLADRAELPHDEDGIDVTLKRTSAGDLVVHVSGEHPE